MQRKMRPEELARRIVELWLQRPKHRRTEDDVIVFYGWLSEHEPGLIPAPGGSYHRLLEILGEHVSPT